MFGITSQTCIPLCSSTPAPEQSKWLTTWQPKQKTDVINLISRPGLQRKDSGCFAPLVLLIYSYISGVMCHGDVHDSGIDLGLWHTIHSLSVSSCMCQWLTWKSGLLTLFNVLCWHAASISRTPTTLDGCVYTNLTAVNFPAHMVLLQSTYEGERHISFLSLMQLAIPPRLISSCWLPVGVEHNWEIGTSTQRSTGIFSFSSNQRGHLCWSFEIIFIHFKN